MQKPGGWLGAVIHHIDPRNFPHASGDGMGDLHGIEARLVHVAGLGVDAIGIPACWPSPTADFDRLLARARALGLKVVIDPVPSHDPDEPPALLEHLSALVNQYPDVVALGESSCEDLPASLAGDGSPGAVRRTVEALLAHLPDGWPCWSVDSREVARAGLGAMPAHVAIQHIALACSLRGSTCLHPAEVPGSPEADSTLRRFLHWRHRQPALMAGDIRFLDAPDPVLAFERMHPEQRMRVVFNLSDTPQTLVLPGLETLQADRGHGLAAGQADDRQVQLPARGVYYAVAPAG